MLGYGLILSFVLIPEVYYQKMCYQDLIVQPVRIIVNDNRESKMLVSELTRDWTEKNKSLEYLHYKLIASIIKNRVKIVDSTLPENLRHSYYQQYPFIVYGDDRKQNSLTHYDKMSFTETSYPLLSTYALLTRFDSDIKKYDKVVSSIEAQCESSNYLKAERWCMTYWASEYTDLDANFNHYPESSEDSECVECNYVSLPYSLIKSHFGDRPGFPEEIKPVFPPYPIKKFPWE